MSGLANIRVLVSVRDETEALAAAAAGVALIDLKEPNDGALGALPIARIHAVVRAVKRAGSPARISATVGDLRLDDAAAMAALPRRIAATAACGVDWVKVGVDASTGSPAQATALLDLLASQPTPVVPVFIADGGVANGLLDHAARHRFPAWMLDTSDKSRSLLERHDDATLARFIARAHRTGARAGLAGSLRLADWPRIAALAPDVAGFRGAVCAGDRRQGLDAARLAALLSTARVGKAAAIATIS
ncbi:(5-formylfuran-3-yl)methyl phosphate synthase [Caldimonas sp. KR1-144]|uniref:(5-formylfuran-3-yl)methyl phosphate synthase n=1 Tax=Caldimonas sp. KR1-144 TaxID=3400911 RepID=UPI003C027B1D